MNSSVTRLGVFLAVSLVLSSAAIVPMLPYVEAATTTLSTNTIQDHTIHVSSIDLDGNDISGMWTTVRSIDGTLLKSGFTPFEFDGEFGTEYKVTVAHFDGMIFHHWEDDSSTSKSRIVELTSNAELVAVYDAGDSVRGYASLTYTGLEEQHDLTVNATTLDGIRLLHMWTIIDPQSSDESGTTYKVYASNYKDRVFDHWEDGSTSRIRTLTIDEATTITAYYKTGTSTVSFSAHDVGGSGTPECADVIIGTCGPYTGSANKSDGVVTGGWHQVLPRGALCGDGGPFQELTTDGNTFELIGTYEGTCGGIEIGTPVIVEGECGANSEISFTIGGIESRFIGDSTCSI